MAYIKDYDNDCCAKACSPCIEKEPEQKIELVSVTLKIKDTDREIVITNKDVEDIGYCYPWQELPTNEKILQIIITELSKKI